ncbi:MAG: dethiobiotin synthase [Methyloprofundus sp.]|nr:dethiobiotin synthase [Methyloprofundus sp.]
MAQGYFVTGTDTGIGKTWSTLALMQYYQDLGKTVLGMKPIASGCEWQDGQLKNEDALHIHEQASIDLPYQDINPYAFELPVSPHIAAAEAGVNIEIEHIVAQYQKLAKMADVVLVEGVGGWLVPLNEFEVVADLAKRLCLPVIVVVGIRLGCINQAKLTFAAIEQAGVKCHGWIASCVDPDMQMLDENIAIISKATPMPLLAVFPFLEKIDKHMLAKKIAK